MVVSSVWKRKNTIGTIGLCLERKHRRTPHSRSWRFSGRNNTTTPSARSRSACRTPTTVVMWRLTAWGQNTRLASTRETRRDPLSVAASTRHEARACLHIILNPPKSFLANDFARTSSVRAVREYAVTSVCYGFDFSLPRAVFPISTRGNLAEMSVLTIRGHTWVGSVCHWAFCRASFNWVASTRDRGSRTIAP
jgi:hypothetical protein